MLKPAAVLGFVDASRQLQSYSPVEAIVIVIVIVVVFVIVIVFVPHFCFCRCCYF